MPGPHHNRSLCVFIDRWVIGVLFLYTLLPFVWIRVEFLWAPLSKVRLMKLFGVNLGEGPQGFVIDATLKWWDHIGKNKVCHIYSHQQQA